jgi:CheY-like chemotaxis protein
VINDLPKHQLLIVDDEPGIRDSFAMLLRASGYEVRTAENGLAALLLIKQLTPDLIISDLNMPQMSGFEFLSVVRRRFPTVPVIAVSGAYDFSDRVPSGVLADFFYAKGRHHPSELIAKVAELILNGVTEANSKRENSAVWIPRNGSTPDGVPFVVVTCPECLRSFPLNVEHAGSQEVQETRCLSCDAAVRYIIDFSILVVSPKKRSATAGTLNGSTASQK